MEDRGVSGIILAGGASTRMGFNKALALLGPDLRLADAVVAAVTPLSADIILVANDPHNYAHLNVTVVGDLYPGMGSLGGLYSGLVAAAHEYSLVVGCDMPFLNEMLWDYMLRQPRRYDVLMPRLGGHLEPLHSIYSKRCMPAIRRLLDRGCIKVTAFLEEVTVRYISEPDVDPLDPEHTSFLNVNTPTQLETARAILRQRACPDNVRR